MDQNQNSNSVTVTDGQPSRPQKSPPESSPIQAVPSKPLKNGAELAMAASTPHIENNNALVVSSTKNPTAPQTNALPPAIPGVIRKVSIHCTNTDGLGESYLGRYTDQPYEWAIIRYGPHRGKFIADLKQSSKLPKRKAFFRFFIPNAYGEAPGTDDFREYGLRDFACLEALHTGDWWNIYIFAEAEVYLPGSLEIQIVTSWAMGGIDSTNGRDSLEDIGLEELHDLRCALERLGFSSPAIDRAFHQSTTVDQ